MKNNKVTIDLALRQQPDYSCLKGLPGDVRSRIRHSERFIQDNHRFPLSFKVVTLVFSLLAFAALSQVSYHQTLPQADILDLRFFSYQATPSIDLVSVNSHEIMP